MSTTNTSNPQPPFPDDGDPSTLLLFIGSSLIIGGFFCLHMGLGFIASGIAVLLFATSDKDSPYSMRNTGKPEDIYREH